MGKDGMSGLAGRVCGIAALMIGSAVIYGLYRKFAPSTTASTTQAASTTEVIPEIGFGAKEIAFGANEWKKYYGDVGIEPPLPSNIQEILNAPCRLGTGKTVRETHLLTLVPATVDGKPFTLKLLSELVKDPKTGFATQFKTLALGVYQDKPPAKSYWVLMSRDILEGSLKGNPEAHGDRVVKLAKETKIPYAFPKVLEAATSILMHHVRTGEKLYQKYSTRCQENYMSAKEKDMCWVLTVGCFASDGLKVAPPPVRAYDAGFDLLGVSVCWSLE
jgi:hypothetical protein